MFNIRDIVVLARDAAMSATYKPALLKAIVRLQSERGRETLSLTELAEQFVLLYWTQTVVFHLRQAASLSKEPEIPRAVRNAAEQSHCRKLRDLPSATRARLVKSITGILRINVLERFHKRLPPGSDPIYTWDGGEAITFTATAVEFVRKNAMALEVIANYWWAGYLEQVNLLAPAIIQKIETDGIRRGSLQWFYKRVAETDHVACFYCGASLSNVGGSKHIDHVLPWSFLLADPAWDLVLACERCNLGKSDRLPDRRFIEQLEALNRRRLTIMPDFMRNSAPIPAGGILQLYEAARAVEWPNAWEPNRSEHG